MSEETKALVLRSANRVNDTTFDRIWKFYYEKSDIELKEKEEEIRARLLNVWKLLGDILTDRNAVLAHLEWCRDQGYRIKERIAYEDLRYAKMLFGNPRAQVKTAQRAIMSELLLQRINLMTKFRDDQGNIVDRVLDADENIALSRLIKEYNELNGLKGPDASNGARAPIQITFNSDPEILKKQIEEMRKKAAAANAQDTEYQEVD